MRTRFCFFGARARNEGFRKILARFGSLFARFGVLMLLPDAPGTKYTHLAHPEHIGDTRKQFPTCKGLIPSILTPRGAWAAPWSFCAHKNSIKVSRTHFLGPGARTHASQPPGQEKWFAGLFWGFYAHKTTFRAIFGAAGAPWNGLVGHVGAFSGIKNQFRCLTIC